MHITFQQAANSLARSRWGKDFKSLEEATEHIALHPEKITAYALVELLSRLDKFAASTKDEDKVDRSVEITGNEGHFPDTSIGDSLYSYDIDEGVDRCVVIAKGPRGECFVITVYNSDQQTSVRRYQFGYWAGSDWHSSPVEALRASIQSEREYHGSGLKRIEACATAIADSSDITRFIDGLSDLDEDTD